MTDCPGEGGMQLQRIVSRCKADLSVRYGDTELGSVELVRNIISSRVLEMTDGGCLLFCPPQSQRLN